MGSIFMLTFVRLLGKSNLTAASTVTVGHITPFQRIECFIKNRHNIYNKYYPAFGLLLPLNITGAQKLKFCYCEQY